MFSVLGGREIEGRSGTTLEGEAGVNDPAGIALMLVAALARPLAVATTIPAARFTRAERLFITWSGLKGAVPILLAAFAVSAGAPDADHVYELVFVVVLCSVIGQGTLVPAVARRLRIPMHDHPA